MAAPSPRSHIYRLVILLLAVFVAFMGIRALATPDSWNYEIAHWFRKDSLEDIKRQSRIHGGNDSCQECHEEDFEEIMEFEHATLNCESCHGPLADHVTGDKKTADAIVDETQTQCMWCHSELISRPEDFPQFTLEERRHRRKEAAECLECHDAHDPEV